jgi:hypothetical protein
MDFSGMRSNNVAHPQQEKRDCGFVIAAKQLSLKEYEALHAPVPGISKRLLRAMRGHIQLFVA